MRRGCEREGGGLKSYFRLLQQSFFFSKARRGFCWLGVWFWNERIFPIPFSFPDPYGKLFPRQKRNIENFDSRVWRRQHVCVMKCVVFWNLCTFRSCFCGVQTSSFNENLTFSISVGEKNIFPILLFNFIYVYLKTSKLLP